MANYKFVRNNPDDMIWWVDNAKERKGEWLFTFDKVHVFNMFRDYPHALTKKQVEQFDKENPYWAKFFADRKPK